MSIPFKAPPTAPLTKTIVVATPSIRSAMAPLPGNPQRQ